MHAIALQHTAEYRNERMSKNAFAILEFRIPFVMTKTDAWWNVNQSVTVDWLRFPMVFCVLFIHIGPDTMCFLDADYLFFSAQGLCNAVFITLSQVVSRVAVPFFFFTSGFFFFSN